MYNNIATPGVTKELLNRYDIRLSKRLGQNFLVDQNIIDIIVKSADIIEGDNIIEIGPGIGSLTEKIIKNLNKGRLFAIEKDKRLVQILHDIFKGDIEIGNIEIINKDVLDIDWSSFWKEYNLINKPLKLMANLPYYITTPIIMGLLEARVPVDRYVFMVQKEVAERMAADPGGKDYGALSIAVQYYSTPEIVHIVPASVFIPQPNVDSAIIKLDKNPEPPIELLDEDFFFKIVRAIFQQRRKNIKNSLLKAANIKLGKEQILNSLEEMGLDKRVRGEKLSIEQIGELSNLIYQRKQKNT